MQDERIAGAFNIMNKKSGTLKIDFDTDLYKGIRILAIDDRIIKNPASVHIVKPGINMTLIGPEKKDIQISGISVSSSCFVLVFCLAQPDMDSPLLTKGEASGDCKKKCCDSCIITGYGNYVKSDKPFKLSCGYLVIITVDNDTFMHMLENPRNETPEMRTKEKEDLDGFFLSIRPMDAATRVILKQMIMLPADCLGRRISCDKASLQLISREIVYLKQTAQKGSAKDPYLSLLERARIMEARDILFKNLEAPPDIKTLARLVGLNEFKLKSGYKKIFGEPPMAHLRRHRMRKARAMLSIPGTSVTQTALRVGYSNPSSFAACFAAYYGCTPSTMKQ